MKGKFTKVQNLGIVKTAVITGVFNGKTIELGVTNTNTTWGTICGSRTPKVGEEIEVSDDMIQVANNPQTGTPTGRYFIARVGADKALAAVKMLQAEAAMKALTI
jgi:hypothetical protein